jgi:hypothetical protein
VTIASLIVDVAANTVKLTKDVDQINNKLGSIEKIAGTVGKTLAGAFTVTAVVGAAKQVIDFASHLTDLSQKLGVSTSTIQKWELAFAESGVPIDAVARASTELANRLVGGDKSAVAALQKLGIPIAELKRMSPEDQFNKVADAVGNIQNKSEQIYASKTLFGKGGVALLAGLNGHLAETTAKFEAMGLIIDEKMIAAADDFGDQLGLMGKQLLAIIASVLGPMLPALSAFGNALMAIGGIVGDLTKGFIDWSVKGLVAAWSGINRFLSSMLDAAQSIPLVGKHLGFLSGASETLKRNAVDADRYLVELFTTTDKVGMSAKKAAPPLLGLGDAADSTGRKAAKAAEGLKLLAAHNLKLTDPDDMKIGGLPMVGLLGDLSQAARDHMRDLQPLDATMLDFGTVTLPNVTSSLQRTAAATASFGTTLKTNMKSSLSGLNGIFQSAFEGGGGVKGAIQSFATNAVAGITSAIPVIGPIISQFSGAIVAGFKKLFGGVSQAELDGRKAVQGFEQQLASTLTATQKLEAGGQQWKMTTIAVRDAYLATGRSSAEAEIAVKKLWDSSKLGAEATKAAIDEVNAVLQEQQADQKRAKELIDEYHISIDQLGPAFRAQQLNEQAKSVMNDFRVMVDVLGVDAPVAIDLMKDKINAYIHDAIATGTEVPASMQPMLQKMVDMGVLTDDNGVAITDLKTSGITFAETLTQGIDRIVAKFDQLMEKLGLIPSALNAIPDVDVAVNANVHWNVPDFPARDVEFASRGGLVTSSGIQYLAGGGTVLPFVPRGTDTVPAMLTPGELVLNRREAHAYRAGAGDQVSLSEWKALRASQERTERYLTGQFAKDLARANRDAIQTAGRR